MATRKEMREEITRLEEESRELHFAYARTGNENTRTAMLALDNRINELEEYLQKVNDQWSGVIDRLQERRHQRR